MSKNPEEWPLIWITGAGGLIGNHLAKTAPRHAPVWRVKPLTRAELDLTDFAAVERLYREDSPALVIHCAALSKSPACEANPALARKLNVEVTGFLSALAAASGFIHFSTDLVFDGQKGGYTEVDKVNPLSVYAETKVASEEIVLKTPGHAVIRTSLNGGASPTGDRGFNEELRRSWAAGKATPLFRDEYRSPIAAKVTAEAVWELAHLKLANMGISGLYHLAGEERLSRLEIGQEVARRCPELRPKIEETSLATYNGPRRPPDTSFNCLKLATILSVRLTGLRSWLWKHPEEFF